MSDVNVTPGTQVCPGGVCVFSARGELLGTVVTDARVGNCVLGADGWLYIAASTKLLRIQTNATP
jgi:sugar lactone lactonase YvrE